MWEEGPSNGSLYEGFEFCGEGSVAGLRRFYKVLGFRVSRSVLRLRVMCRKLGFWRGPAPQKAAEGNLGMDLRDEVIQGRDRDRPEIQNLNSRRL